LLYKRILLKLSGEALAGSKRFGIDKGTLAAMTASVKGALDLGIQMGIVIGGGNIFRGIDASSGSNRVNADYMGMLATVINALAFKDALETIKVEARVLSAIDMPQVTEHHTNAGALKHLEEGRVVIFAGGTGNPFFTTDTNAALRALEIGAEVLVKATKVNGIYDRDPMKHRDATFFPMLDFDTVLNLNLGVMDATAVSLCRENNLEVRVINVFDGENLVRLIRGEEVGSIVRARRDV
jgi:uridylate kinase